jgi:uncharacterized protein (DUF1697 family)
VAAFVALLRAVNVGGTGKLPMAELKALCVGLGLEQVRTYIQSGNVVFDSTLSEGALAAKLTGVLSERIGKPIGVLVRTGADLTRIVDANPFPAANPARVGVVFLPEPAPGHILADIPIPGDEEIQAVGREVFIHFPDGMGRSKLKFSGMLATGTTRNMNTIRALAALAADVPTPLRHGPIKSTAVR